MKDYHINIFFSDEDGGYIADIPDLAHCSAFGETPEDALAQALIAKRAWLHRWRHANGIAHRRPEAAWLEAAQAEGKVIPQPKYRPVIYQLTIAAG
jgi:predicted RNase H-like HicB family nuclease